MISFFPDPYPDEILYSVCARYQDRVRYPNNAATIQELFGSGSAIASIDLPNRLSYLIKILPPGHCYTIDRLIDEHTLLPFYLPFLPQARQTLLREDMKGTEISVIHRRAGIMASRVKQPDWLKFCPVCVQEDRNQFGEAYWHRLHQVPGVEICPNHCAILHNSHVRARYRENNQKFIAADQVISNTGAILSINCSKSSEQLLLNFAKNVQWLLSKTSIISELEKVRKRYQSLLAEKGLATYSGIIRLQQLVKTFKNCYPTELLQNLQSELDEQNEQNWLVRLVRNKKGVQHPLRHLLLIDFLGFTAEEFFHLSEESQPFGQGKWLCLNPICDYFHQPVITEHWIHHDSHNGNPLGVFTCPYCQFTYQRKGSDKTPEDQFRISRVKLYGAIWDNVLKTLWEDPTLSMTEVAEKLGFDWRTVQKQAVRLNLCFPRPGPTARMTNLLVSPLQESQGKQTSLQKIESYREEWLEIRKTYPEKGRRQLQHDFRRVYTWLRRNDLEWLEKQLPVRKAKKLPSSYGVNWAERDCQLVREVKLSAERLKKVSGRPLHITVSSIGRDIGQKTLLQQQLHKLPLTAQAITEVVEAQEQFVIRRIWWAADCFRTEGINPTRTKLLLRASVNRNMAVKPEVSTAIEEALRSLEII
ncbi:MAG TPA: TnsD family Tn7-like transposition protein [Oculatellaceae cyanobacterium]|jgi:hypothetical protein